MHDDAEPSMGRPINDDQCACDSSAPDDPLPSESSIQAGSGKEAGTRPPAAPPVHGMAPIGSGRMRFCDACGAEWLPEWVACAACPQTTSPNPAAKPRISLASPLALYFVLLATLLPGTFLPDPFATTLAISILDSVIVMIWCLASWREIVPLVRCAPTGRNFTGAILLGALTFAFAHVSVGLLSELFGFEAFYFFSESFGADYGWGVVILIICIQPAVIEELAFRGIILGGLRTAMDDRDAVIVSSMMFMILHVQVFSILHLLLMGICAGYLRLKTRSIWPCIALHFTHNSLVLLFEYLQFP